VSNFTGKTDTIEEPKRLKVMKFGGTSVGSVESILSLKRIVEEEARQRRVIVVVSALGGITDQLLSTATLAVGGNERWRGEFEAMTVRHHDMIAAIISSEKEREALLVRIDALFEQLRSIYYGVFLIRDLSEKTRDTIVSYGELLSSTIVATLLDGAAWKDPRDFIRTEQRGGRRLLAAPESYKLVEEAFRDGAMLTVTGGFIARDIATGETTNLGRGGSDYTAAIIAAALGAESLEIWTDVDGFMTADPKVIHTAYTIDRLSYLEAMELCNFGAKVIYPPTIYPVCVKNIPIRVKNTFNPEAEGVHGVAGLFGELHVGRRAR